MILQGVKRMDCYTAVYGYTDKMVLPVGHISKESTTQAFTLWSCGKIQSQTGTLYPASLLSCLQGLAILQNDPSRLLEGCHYVPWIDKI